jgi:hypothetical protein
MNQFIGCDVHKKFSLFVARNEKDKHRQINSKIMKKNCPPSRVWSNDLPTPARRKPGSCGAGIVKLTSRGRFCSEDRPRFLPFSRHASPLAGQ